MSPSQGGRSAGEPNPIPVLSHSTSSTFLRDTTIPSSRLAADTKANPWPLHTPVTSSGSGKIRHSSTTTSTVPSSFMIGPTSTFYDPEVLTQHQGDSHNQYHQWIAAYGGQQQNSQQQQQQQVPASYQPLNQQAYLHTPGQVSNQYNFVQSPYPPPSHYAESTTRTAGQSGVGNSGPLLNNNTSYFQSQNGDSYAEYFSVSTTATGTNTPDVSTTHTPSYSTTPDPLYQQQRPHPQTQRQQPQSHRDEGSAHSRSHSQSYYHPTTSGYTSDLQSLSTQSHPNSTHSSSLSPTSNSWIDEIGSSGGMKINTKSANTLPSTDDNTKMDVPSTKPNATFTNAKNIRPYPSKIQVHTSPSAVPPASNPPKSTGKRKRARKNTHATESLQHLYRFEGGGSDSDSEDDPVGFGATMNVSMGGGFSVGMGGLGVIGSGGRIGRLPGACTHCKKLKMKCDFPKNNNTCKRCKGGGHVCIVEGRKPRTAPNKREYLLAQIRQKDAIIESLLKQLHNPYIATPMSIASYRMATSPSDTNNRNILAWLDRLQASVQTAGGTGGAGAFKDLRGSNMTGDDDSDGDESRSHPQRSGLAPAPDDDDDTVGGEEGTTQGGDKLSSLPESHVPLGLIADLSLSNNKAKNGKKEQKDLVTAEENLDDDAFGVANETYFMPGPATDLGIRATLIEQHSPPEILVHGLVTPEDVDKLFEIFYNNINPFISLLDPVLHTPASTFARCPFLFTVICAISSRYYSEKSEIYPIAMHFAKHSAANALIDGWKSVELCQAYILMSIYAVPARRWEEDRSWLYTGLAIRIATDLNLHQVSSTKPQNEKQEREILNRTRVWMMCFNLDRSTATQFGKPSTIKEDYIMRNAKDWYKKSKYNLSYDVHLCAHSALLQIVAKSHDEIFSDPSAPTGLNKRVDFRTVTINHDAQLTRYHEEWSKIFAEHSDPHDPGCAFRCSLLPFLVGYSRLVMFSFGFQQAYQRGIEPGDHVYFTKCLDAAKSVIRNMIEGLAPSGYMRYAPDGHFIFASFASAFLLKLLRPEFSNLLSKDQETEIFDLIGRLIQTLSSPDIAIDDRHTPKLYARFLAGLLSRHRRDGATVGRLQTHPPPSSSPKDFTQAFAPSLSTTFSASQSRSGNNQGNNHGPSSYNRPAESLDSTPIYHPEATFSVGTGPIHFGSDFGLSGYGNGVSDEEMLATMQALKNPAWWQNMMMPGFSWPDPQSPASNASSGNSPPSYANNHQGMNVPGFNTGVGAFQSAQVPLH